MYGGSSKTNDEGMPLSNVEDNNFDNIWPMQSRKQNKK